MSAALDRLIRDYGGLIRSRLRAMDRALTEADLDDLEQEVHIRLWQQLQRESKLHSPASLIKQLVLSVAVDAARRVQARGGKGSHEALEEWQLSGADDDELVEHAYFRARLQSVEAVLKEFDEDGARAIRLYCAGFTTEEAGRLMDCSEAKARNLTYRGLKVLKDKLQGTDTV